MGTKLTFVVTVECNTGIEPKVIENYVHMAIKKYYKESRSPAAENYFDRYTGLPKFVVSMIPDADWKDLRAIAQQLRAVDEHLMKAGKIEERERD